MQGNASEPGRPGGRHTSFEIISVPVESVPRVSWGTRLTIVLVLIAMVTGSVVLGLWQPPRVEEGLAWEQIAPPETVPMRPWHWLVIHHSATRSGDPQSFDTEHVQGRGWDGIGYHFVIGNGRPMPLGRIEATFRWRNQTHGAHAGNAVFNQEGIGICLVGDFDRDAPDGFLEKRLVELCALLLDRIPTLSIARLVGHRDVPGKVTGCPGRFFDVERIRFLVREQMEQQGLMVR
jgi:hypothetical protein